MARFTFLAVITAMVILGFLGITYLKDSYKVLPIGASKEFEPGPFAEWRLFTAPSGQFEVDLPTIPQNAKQTIIDPKTKLPRQYDMYVAQMSNNTVYMVSLIRFPNSKESPEILKKTVVNDLMAANPVNQLKNMEVGDFQNFKTLDFTIENNLMQINGRTFMDRETLYLLTAIYPTGQFKQEDYDHFIKSFALSPPEDTK